MSGSRSARTDRSGRFRQAAHPDGLFRRKMVGSVAAGSRRGPAEEAAKLFEDLTLMRAAIIANG